MGLFTNSEKFSPISEMYVHRHTHTHYLSKCSLGAHSSVHSEDSGLY